ncbi:MAG: branched-chain amino acid aminotransferase [Pseudomonadota bacterium]
MPLNPNRQIWTWFEGDWHAGNVPIMGSADHGTWLGTMVFDGARAFNNVTPDLDLHCARVNHSTEVLGMNIVMETGKILELAEDGVKKFAPGAELYIRPMCWSTQAGDMTVDPDPTSTRFALCLEEAAMPPFMGTTLTTTKFVRPTLASATVNAKASCLYPNNARMLKEAQDKGFANVISCDALGNVAETATSNIWMVKDGEYLTPIPNGTFLAGITRARILKLLRDAGESVRETTLALDDFRNADEIFLSGNYAKVTPALKFEGREFEIGPKTTHARDLYWEWAGA